MDRPPALAPTGVDPSSPGLDLAPWPMLEVGGARHVVQYINPAFCRLLGKHRAEIEGRPVGDILAAEHEWMRALDRVFRSERPENHPAPEPSEPAGAFHPYTVWPVRADGRTVGVMLQVTEAAQFHDQALALSEALVLGAVRQHELIDAADSSNAFLQEEISARKEAQKTLRRAQMKLTAYAEELEAEVIARTAELVATNQQLEAFIYSIAHDLRAPLRSMQGFSELLVDEVGATLNETARNYADRISKSAQFMDALLSDLLAFSRISQQHVELAAVQLEVAVAAVLSRLQKEIQETHAVVESSGPWPSVRAHAPTLAQVLFNLTSNALKFIVEGQPPVVRVHAEERAECIRVWVEDNGPGIAPEYQAQVFALFNRLHGEKYPGTGIGLAIVKKAVERMSGRVGLESTPGQGSRFWFELQKV